MPCVSQSPFINCTSVDCSNRTRIARLVAYVASHKIIYIEFHLLINLSMNKFYQLIF